MSERAEKEQITQGQLSNNILSDITVFSKYAKYIPSKNRRETWNEIVDRYVNMMKDKYKNLHVEIDLYSSYIYNKQILPSMRALQFAGAPIDRNPSRIYNCAYLPIDDYRAFSEAMFLLLGGTGVGYSVQFAHVDKLPEITKPTKSKRYLVGDSIEGWADAIKALVKSYLGYTSTKPIFDLSDIRKKGARLITAGGKAPGPEPLKTCLFQIETILERKNNGEKLSPIDCHDILCFIANSVLAGGIRRAAMISLFSFDDEEMLACKSGNWWELNEQRGRANNSAVIVRNRISKEEWDRVWKLIELSNAGEPGVYFTNDANWGTNPCQPKWATVITPMGLSTIGDIKIGDNIWSESGWTKVLNKWSTGIKKVKRYETSSGVFYGTENHRLLSEGVKIEAKDCKVIDSLRGPNVPHSNGLYHHLYNQDIVDGLVVGDGTMHRASNNRIVLYIGNNDQDYFTSDIKEYIGDKSSISLKAYNIKTTITHLDNTFNRRIPKEFFENQDKLRFFLKGLYSANGSFVSNRVTFKTASSKLREDLQLALSYLGIKSYYTTNKATNVKFSNGNYICKESYDINISTDVDKFQREIGFLQKYKNTKVKEYLAKNIKKQDRISYKLLKVEDISEEEVFDITVSNETHTYWTGGLNVSNCCEIALRPFQFCNLTEVNVSNIESQEDLNRRVIAASFFGTLQAGFTDFHYLRDIWRKTTEKDSLVGVGMTGIGSGVVLDYDLELAAKVAKDINQKYSDKINIDPAARVTTIKPSGTSSCVLGTSSGIHAWHNDFYLRSIRLGKNEALYTYLSIYAPQLLEDDFFRPETQAIVRIPQNAPSTAILRTESALDLLERVKRFNLEWVREGHRKGANTNNVSATISINKENLYLSEDNSIIRDNIEEALVVKNSGNSDILNEWEVVGEWMWDNRNNFNGLSVLPFNSGSYVQAPFEDITEEEFNKRMKTLTSIDLSKVVELEDETAHSQEAACSGNACEI